MLAGRRLKRPGALLYESWEDGRGDACANALLLCRLDVGSDER